MFDENGDPLSRVVCDGVVTSFRSLSILLCCYSFLVLTMANYGFVHVPLQLSCAMLLSKS